MKTPLREPIEAGTARLPIILLAAASLLTSSSPATAGEKQAVEAVAITLAVDPGEQSVTPSGTVHTDDMSAVAMQLSENPLFTGRTTWIGDFEGKLNSEGTQLVGVGSGSGILEVGTWDANYQFTPSPGGDVFQTRWEGSGDLFGIIVVKVMGHGIAGDVLGMQFNVEWEGTMGVSDVTGQILDPKAKK